MTDPRTPPLAAGAQSEELDQALLGHRNLIAFNRALTRWGSRGELEEEAGAVLCAGGTWIPVVANGAFRSDDRLHVAPEPAVQPWRVCRRSYSSYSRHVLLSTSSACRSPVDRGPPSM